MERKVYISQLLDYYDKLLPEKQQICMSLYYNDDLSLGEIAENLCMTRQGVRDYLKRGELMLESFEEELGLFEKNKGLNDIIAELEKIALSANDTSIREDIGVLLNKMKGMV